MLVVAVVYLFFPGNNLFSEDSIAYANNVKYGESLFWPHHLLYSAFNYCLYIPFKQIIHSLDAFRFMQLVNGISGLLCLCVFNKIVMKLTGDKKWANTWTFFVACCFGVIRFSVEIETYIQPLFFSLLSSLFFLKYQNTCKMYYVVFCSLTASIACLFHQIHLFWGIGLFVGFILYGRWKPVVVYALPTLSVLVVYSLVMVFYNDIPFSCSNLTTYLLDYYYSEKADISFGVSNVLLTGISFFRTFFQVHGIIIDVLRLIPFFWIVIPVVLILLGVGVYHLKGFRFKPVHLMENRFELTHLIIFFLQFSFAFFSDGNAEFMVMLPFLIPLFIPCLFDFNLKAVPYISVALLIWNFCFSVYPNHHFDYFNNRHLLQIIDQHPNKAFILMQRNVIVEQYYYETGKYEDFRLIHADSEEDITRLRSENRIFYTDVLTKKMPFNRAQFIQVHNYDNLHFRKRIKKIYTDLGAFYIDEISPEVR
ncbi:hypothetical protein [Massilibacteroides sp.]|uniref:hypothetical protein n=1 Tax=Massilibacteroides sp. TaxID=2034766 RepID=UPI0026153705|nr:hypothetical protein [Massilibacteroides sp.]MDD4516603.1 hypothetical protein [Massilibacteroides sp.]